MNYLGLAIIDITPEPFARGHPNGSYSYIYPRKETL